MNLKTKILYSVDAGLFFTGTILILLSYNGGNEIEARMVIGSILLSLFYVLFPFIDREKKEKIYATLSIHFIIFVVCLFSLYGSLRFYTEPQNNGILGEILAPIGLILAFSYVSYVLIEFVRALLLAFTKLKSYLFSSSVQENYSATKKIIEGITAFIVAVTAMGASISAFIASINALFN